VVEETAGWWEPDKEVLEATLSGRYKLADMTTADRCWVIAELSEMGWSTLRISQVLRCTQRHVKRLRANVLTQYMRRERRHEGELRVLSERAERAERDVLVIRRERDELRALFGGHS